MRPTAVALVLVASVPAFAWGGADPFGEPPTGHLPMTTAPFAQEAQLLAADGAFSDYLGWSVAVSGSTAVVGARNADTVGGVDAGAVYVFVRSGTSWTQQQKVTASDGAANHYFGWSVAVSGDTMVVGNLAPCCAEPGAAYVFVRSGTTWTEQQKLLPSVGTDTAFGFSVAVDGDTVVVGALSGKAYVFVRSGTTWSVQQRLLPSAGTTADAFGGAVSVSGDTAVVGAYSDDTPVGGVNAGSAYVFVRAGTTWTEQQKLVAPDGSVGDSFGISVAVSGDTAVVGAFLDDTLATDDGSAYVFARSGTTWTQQRKLLPSDASARRFGVSVSISAATVVVGSYFGGAGNTGAAFVWVRSGTSWAETQRLVASDGAAVDFFGYSVAIAGDTVVVGAPLDDTTADVDAGSAYVFVRPTTTAFYTLTPCRVVDTRVTPPALAANSTRTFPVGGLCSVPTDARAAAAILIAVNPGDLGDLRLYPTGQPAPLASTINFAAAHTRANNAIVPLGTGGQINVQCDMPPGSTASTHFVLDVFGYFR